MKVFAELGSVSHGTMRPEDLLPRFMEALDELREEPSQPGPVDDRTAYQRSRRAGRLDTIMGNIERNMEQENYFQSEQADWDMETLINELQGFAPPLTYFGAHMGGWLRLRFLDRLGRYL